MSDWIQLTTSIVTLLGVGGSIWLALLNRKQIEVVHRATNSMKDELVAAVGEAAHAKGMSDERDKVASAVDQARKTQ